MPSLDPQAASALRDKLMGYRKRLLDLSLRNKLLNWKPSKRFTIDLREIGLVEAYKTLVEKEGSIELIPEYDEETYAAAEADIPDRTGFLTGLAEEDLANKCLRSRREADALQRDSGINYLHVCLGFIEWTEAATSEKVLKAPLVLVPVTLVKSGINEVTGIAEYEVKNDQTEVILNPSLVEKLRSEFGLELPSFSGTENAPPDAEALKEFVTKIADIAKMRAHWKFRDDIRLTFLSFAKLRMYRDLDPSQWEKDPLEDNILIQSLFGLASANEPGSGADNGQTVEENPKADGLPLVVLADSSQHQAVADAVQGANMVIEGPPGTGKSQTLTNIIACLISSGKSVLFVAEKFAALDVVRGNLESVGLDAFCFGMHGARASKSAVYSDLKKRLEANFPPPRRLDSVRAEWQSTRKTLNDYVVAASQRIGPREETYTEICGKVEALRSKKLSPPLSMIGDGKLSRFQERETFLSDAQGVMSDRQIPRQHGWLGLDAQNLAAGHEDHLLHPLPRVLQLLTFLVECEHFIATTLDTKVHLKLEDCIGLTSTRLSPFALSESIIWDAKQNLSVATNRAVVEKCQAEALAIEKAAGEASAILPRDKRSLLRADLQEGLSRMSDRTFYTLAIRDISVESFRSLGENLVRLGEMFTEAESLQLAAQTTLGGGLVLRDQLATFRALTPGIQEDLAKEHFQNGLHSIVDRCKQQGTALLERRNALSGTFSLVGDLPPAVELRQVREDIKIHGSNGFARIFSGKYRQARKSTYRWLTLPKAYKYPGIISDLENLEAIGQDEEAYVSDSAYKKLGALFRGSRTEWPRVESCVAWGHTARNCGLTYGQVSKAVEAENLPKFRELEDEFTRLWKQIDEHLPKIEACGAIDKDQLMDTPLKALGKVLKQWQAWLEAYIAPVQTVIAGDVTVKALTENLGAWASIDEREATLAKHRSLRTCLGPVAQGVATDWKSVHATEAWVDEMQKVGLPQPWFEALLSLEDEAVWAQVIQVISQSAEAWQEIHTTFVGFDGHLNGATKWLKEHITPELSKRVEALIQEADFLPRWSQFCRLRAKADELGVAPYFHAWEKGEIEHTQLTEMFQLVEYRRMAATAIQLNPTLRNFVAEPHEKTREKFRQLDHELTRLNQQAIASSIGARQMPVGNGQGPRKTHTEGSLVRHQVGLQQAQLPLRQLMARASTAVRTIKPCFMMSPLTVSQFLEPGLPKFDVLLMDEASQILPEDALGAIARCHQVVVVGDPKQLPPTSFFRVSSDDDDRDEDEESLVEASESILETCATSFGRTRRLRWHYRSLHESLIAFSNAEFYGDLQIFPSPVRDASKYGIRWHKVDGIYADNRNTIEAAAVVDAIAEQLRSDPTKSIACITFNLKQKELIEDLLAQKGRSDPLLAELIERSEALEEPLIVRNLESIQGEQRDIIFISINFGPATIGAQMAQRFGPINGKTGWRRLNVMFSRAKERMEVFSSITGDAISAEPDAKTGAAYLKRFLNYAETGRLETVTPFGTRGMDSDFERSVAEHIRTLGYDVEAQIGVSGFWIDLGVFHPGRRDRFCIGIECDGASYHSSRVARDRDRIREDVLRSRGWKLHRIWSTDWFQDRTSAISKLAAALRASHE